ncbi:hypothetical protein ACVR05_10730 [Streptococcus caprae]|uniref:Uncharacterized protein n=1 Tax=Streptococcus caprae TaxID=1640501 RepID=A0ABV8CUU1_9STRE
MLKKRLKRILLALSIVFVLAISGFIYINKNLSTYCIYYVKHMPQTHDKDTNPEMVVILDNLVYLGESRVNGIRFDTDGSNAIVKHNEFALGQGNRDNSVKFVLSFFHGKSNERSRMYYFDGSGKFVTYHYMKLDGEDSLYEKTETRKQEAQTYVDEVINPIVEEMEIEPKVNLQWLFNKKYQDRFN